MSPFQNGLSRHYLAAVTAAAIGIEVSQVRMLKTISDSVSDVAYATQEVPKIDALMIRSADLVSGAFADAMTAVGLLAILAVFALGMSRNKLATWALCLVAVTFAVFGGSLLGDILLANVPMFSGLYPAGTPTAPTLATALSLPDSALYAYGIASVGLTLAIAFMLARSTIRPTANVPA